MNKSFGLNCLKTIDTFRQGNWLVHNCKDITMGVLNTTNESEMITKQGLHIHVPTDGKKIELTVSGNGFDLFFQHAQPGKKSISSSAVDNAIGIAQETLQSCTFCQQKLYTLANTATDLWGKSDNPALRALSGKSRTLAVTLERMMGIRP